jgi:hypothetical protein
MSKVPQRGEVWQENDTDDLFYVVAVDKFSIRCVTKGKGKYGIFSINKYDFITHRHFVFDSKYDVEDLFKTENE